MKKLSLFFISVLFGCKKKSVEAGIVSSELAIVYKNAKGTDLLNPNFPMAIKAEDIDAFVLVNGEKQQYFKANMDYPENFKIYKSTNEHYVLVFFCAFIK